MKKRLLMFLVATPLVFGCATAKVAEVNDDHQPQFVVENQDFQKCIEDLEEQYGKSVCLGYGFSHDPNQQMARHIAGEQAKLDYQHSYCKGDLNKLQVWYPRNTRDLSLQYAIAFMPSK